jgi:hypothetical protein
MAVLRHNDALTVNDQHMQQMVIREIVIHHLSVSVSVLGLGVQLSPPSFYA